MNKYDLILYKNEEIPKKINEIELYFLFYELKKILKSKNYDNKKLNNLFCKYFSLTKITSFNKESKNYLKSNIISKINKGNLYQFYLTRITNELHNENFKAVKKLLNSFVESGLIKDGIITKDKQHNYVELTLNNDVITTITHLPISKETSYSYRTKCHFIVEQYIKENPNSKKVAVVQENMELHGKYYHSILIIEDVVFDLAHNLVMKFEDYINLVNPTILLCEDANTVIKNIDELNKSKKFKDSNYYDLLKYGMSKQLKKQA